ncbi:PREDICTED: uncharacterized protein LOC105964377 [Erythranthe guttata]|uniref:uncharacterized protein LOC105964377 n=1 Tax=Erythranthe guttata TaxID=4155 RepID=UPI00064DD6D2|nr:PREDICTED: uncharacterized protein LOC105964377 [Erythranthe guttata]|eukprot:XP_012844355.1 PREDICTED: uncharacterized protein LOC105964377 [Erythranthe guttata]
MSDAKEIKFSLKVMINKKKNKVLFAEADSDFIDVLISFLTLPLGTIVRVLKKHYEDELHGAPFNIGSLTTLYNGLSNLDNVHFWTEGCKDVLLNPKSSFEAECLKLKLDISETQPIGYFICKNNACKAYQARRFPCLSIYYDTVTCCCGVKMKRELGQKESQANEDAGGVFTNNAVPFIISDDLRILPNMKGYVQTLRDLDVTYTNGAELRNVSFGFNEVSILD